MKKWQVITLVFSIILIVYFVQACVLFQVFEKSEYRGQFGDMFGAVNGLFSALAFGGLIISILYQSQDLKNQTDALKFQANELELQRKEMELTREQIELTRLEQKRIADATNDQRDEFIKQGQINQHIGRINILKAKIETYQAALDNNRIGQIRLTTDQKKDFVLGLKATIQEFERYAKKDISNIG